MSGLLYADDLVLCIELEEKLKVMMRYFVKMYRSSLKIYVDKNMMMMLGGDEGLICEVLVDGT